MLSAKTRVAKEERLALVRKYHNGGMPDTRIAAAVGVHRNQVRMDRAELGLPRFSPIDDGHLNSLVKEVSEQLHAGVGLTVIDGQLVRQGVVVQKSRIRQSQVELGLIQPKPKKKLHRAKWYEGLKPDHVWSMDQVRTARAYLTMAAWMTDLLTG